MIPALILGTAALCAGQEVDTHLVAPAVPLTAGQLTGVLVDNVTNRDGQGSGLSPLAHDRYLGKPIFRPELVGLNFEHVFNGAAADKEISMFTPRKDPCRLVLGDTASATLQWPYPASSWRMKSQMTYTFTAPDAIDIAFETTTMEPRFPMGFAAMMWASYMNRTRERAIHFIGRDGDTEGWISFGVDTADGFETGTVACAGVPDLPYEEGAELLNLREHPTKKFTKPFYYGLLDGDNDLTTDDDILAYIVMFDQTEPIRFALWNFIKDDEGNPDPHSPAWDWQYVIRNPIPLKVYGYRMRVVIRPFESREAVEAIYEDWRAHQVKGTPRVLETP